MTKKLLGVAILPLLLSAALVSGQHPERTQADAPLTDKVDNKGNLVGSWRIVSYKYGNMAKFASWPKDQVMLKHITPTHFTWVTYDAKTGVVARMGGGTYSWNGNTYRENLQYGLGADVKGLVGKPQIFTGKVTETRWNHSGTLSQGEKIEEVWERVK